jgi:hypothetical protein
MKWIFAVIAGIVVIGAVVFVSVDDAGAGEIADFGNQGDSDSTFAANSADLARSSDGIRVHVVIPTPTPGSYEYPSGDMVPEWSTTHPDVVVGGPSESEVFTMWAIVFNYPELCTDESCDLDDLADDAPAKGGVYQADGRVADGEELEFSGAVRLGQDPATGSALENPFGAEVHLAIAPHGKMLGGSEGWRQLNGPLGNPTLWWAASFPP